MSALIATVAVAAPLDKSLSYVVPEPLQQGVRPGMRLRVPLGRRQVVGYLLGLAPGDPEGLKPVSEVLDGEPLFPPTLIPLFLRAADYYRHPLGEVIRTALPAGLSGDSARVKVLTERVYLPVEGADPPPGARQREILRFVKECGGATAAAVSSRFPSPHSALRRLCELGHLRDIVQERRRDPFLNQPVSPDRPVCPTDEQEAALRALKEAGARGGFSPFLLHGVTGSGKTEVYLRAIAEVLARGKQALVLVPEIALTPQLVGRFRARFEGEGVRLAVLHSGLSDGERFDAWRMIARGEADIVIGARSAVFAPLPDPGIFVVDEEHETSYKQAEGFRYNARDLALLRGQLSGGIVLMGSATPSLTTFFRAREGQTGYLPLTGRAQERPLPTVDLLDLSLQPPEGILSESLAGALRENLESGGQSLLLLNRRGFAPFLLCSECGQTFRCPNCEITLTYYRSGRRMLCHYCDYGEPPPERCPRCGGDRIEPEGAGTERLEEELQELLPAARIGRMDRDTTARKGAHQGLIQRMERREIDILVGTQMIAKGHDFPSVTLVGVVNADATLNFPDFRSAERTFSLLTQVAGRAGRGETPGRVLLQTWSPDHYALQCAARHDYDAFYEQEAGFRRELGYPPFGHLVNLVFSGLDASRVAQAAERAAAELQGGDGVEVLGPAPCPLARLRGKHRIQLLLKSTSRPHLRHRLGRLEALRRKMPAGVQVAVDVDPVDML